MTDYLAHMLEIPNKHSGPLFEQIQLAAIAATGYLRAHGLPLPGDSTVPNYFKVRAHLRKAVNRALDSYFSTKEVAPKSAGANEIWGEDGDDLFSVTVSGVSHVEAEGFTLEIDMNLLYDGAAE